MAYKIMGVNVSPFVRKVRLFMAEKGVDYELEQISPLSPPDGWRDISPLGKVPALLDGDKIVNDSSCICQYIERKKPAPPLFPASDDDYVHALWIEEFIDAGFVPVAGGKVFFPLIVGPMMSKQPIDDAVKIEVRQVIEDEFPRFWDYLDGEIKDKDFFAGNALSIADLAVTSIHVNLRHAGITVDADRWPHLASFVERMRERPSVRAVIEEEAPEWSLQAA